MAISEHLVSGPCLVMAGNVDEIGILVIDEWNKEAFQILNLVDPLRSELDILNDLKKSYAENDIEEKFKIILKALDYEKLSNKFFQQAKTIVDEMEGEIVKSMRLSRDDDKLKAGHYAIVLMARFFFLHCLEKKRLLNHDTEFIKRHTIDSEEHDTPPRTQRSLWKELFVPLFKDLSIEAKNRSKKMLKDYDFPYLNGGLFAAYSPIEDKPSFLNLEISDDVLKSFHRDCLYKYRLLEEEKSEVDEEKRGVLNPELIGTLFERFMKDDISAETGSVYTPKEIVVFMVRKSLTDYLKTKGLQDKTAFNLVHHKKIEIGNHVTRAEEAIIQLKLLDPCCGSGSFLLTALHELFEIKKVIRAAQGKRWHNGDQRRAYEQILKNNIFGLDINPEAIILCHLRLWLPIINLLEKRSYSDIKPLPNLDLNIREGNAVTSQDCDWEVSSWSSRDLSQIRSLRSNYFSCEFQKTTEIKSEFDQLTRQSIKKGDKQDQHKKASGSMLEVNLSRNFSDIYMGNSKGFHIIIGNPPYLGIKGAKKLAYLKNQKNIEDLYIMVTYQAYRALALDGILSFIISRTYFTDINKQDFRKFLSGQDSQRPVCHPFIVELSPKTFKKAVLPNIIMFSKTVPSSKRIGTPQSVDKVRFLFPKNKKDPTNTFISDLNIDPDRIFKREGEKISHNIYDMTVEDLNRVPFNNFFLPYPEKLQICEF